MQKDCNPWDCIFQHLIMMMKLFLLQTDSAIYTLGKILPWQCYWLFLNIQFLEQCFSYVFLTLTITKKCIFHIDPWHVCMTKTKSLETTLSIIMGNALWRFLVWFYSITLKKLIHLIGFINESKLLLEKYCSRKWAIQKL